MKAILALISAVTLLTSAASAQRKYVGWSTGYYTNWTNTNQHPMSKINFKIYTHLVYFSASPNGNGGGLDAGVSATDGKNFTSLSHANNTKALICVGGAGSGNNYQTATTAANRPAFIRNMINLMQQDNFDGIDIDWEENFNANNNAQYLAMFMELRAELDKITPRPLLTCATAGYFVNTTAPAAQYIDQVNNMSYWTLIGGMAGVMDPFTKAGVAKSKQGVGYGYDPDGEVDINNPNDIGAKCKMAVNDGYGGIMIWEIALACQKCDDTTGYYVDKSITTSARAARMNAIGQSLTISGDGAHPSLAYDLESAGQVDLGIYDAKGSLVRNLLHREQESGPHTLTLDRNTAGTTLRPGAYVVRLATPKGGKAGLLTLR